MKLFHLRALIDETPNSSWDDVIARDVLIIIRTCAAICLFIFLVGGLLMVLGWLDKLIK